MFQAMGGRKLRGKWDKDRVITVKKGMEVKVWGRLRWRLYIF